MLFGLCRVSILSEVSSVSVTVQLSKYIHHLNLCVALRNATHNTGSCQAPALGTIR